MISLAGNLGSRVIVELLECIESLDPHDPLESLESLESMGWGRVGRALRFASNEGDTTQMGDIDTTQMGVK